MQQIQSHYTSPEPHLRVLIQFLQTQIFLAGDGTAGQPITGDTHVLGSDTGPSRTGCKEPKREWVQDNQHPPQEAQQVHSWICSFCPPPKKKSGDGMGLQTSFPRILRPSSIWYVQNRFSEILWQHGCTRSPMQTIGVDVGPSSDLKKITTDYSTSEDLQSFKLGTSYRKNGIKQKKFAPFK